MITYLGHICPGALLFSPNMLPWLLQRKVNNFFSIYRHGRVPKYTTDIRKRSMFRYRDWCFSAGFSVEQALNSFLYTCSYSGEVWTKIHNHNCVIFACYSLSDFNRILTFAGNFTFLALFSVSVVTYHDKCINNDEFGKFRESWMSISCL